MSRRSGKEKWVLTFSFIMVTMLKVYLMVLKLRIRGSFLKHALREWDGVTEGDLTIYLTGLNTSLQTEFKSLLTFSLRGPSCHTGSRCTCCRPPTCLWWSPRPEIPAQRQKKKKLNNLTKPLVNILNHFQSWRCCFVYSRRCSSYQPLDIWRCKTPPQSDWRGHSPAGR